MIIHQEQSYTLKSMQNLRSKWNNVTFTILWSLGLYNYKTIFSW